MGHITKGNVFEDLGFSREESAELALKVDLASEIRTFIERQGLTQARAAVFFDVPRPKVSQIQSGRLEGMSIEYLVRMLGRTGGKFTYSFRQPSRQVAEARVREHLAPG